MSYASKILADVRQKAAPPGEALTEARTRRDAVLARALQFPGVRRSYKSGSIAHGTANAVKDADCGVVLDRKVWSELGPDADGVGPVETVEAMRVHLRDSDLSDSYPEIDFRVQDRAITVFCHHPLADGHDPTVDLIVALERRNAPGLWIPKAMRSTKPSWDASHPEGHTELFLPTDRALRRTRVWTTRLAKLANDRMTTWHCSSFNLASLAFWGLDAVLAEDQALYDFYDFAVKDLSNHLTDDPAGVSNRIKLPKSITLKDAVGRMERHRNLALEALEADTEDEVREPLTKLFGDELVAPPPGGAARLASGLRAGASVYVGPRGPTLERTDGRSTKATRSYGGTLV